jgi:hypothetical protein
MSYSRMLRRVILVRPDVSEEPSAYIIVVSRIGELGKLAVTSNRHTLRRNTMEALKSSEMSVLARATRHKFPEDGIHRNLHIDSIRLGTRIGNLRRGLTKYLNVVLLHPLQVSCPFYSMYHILNVSGRLSTVKIFIS